MFDFDLDFELFELFALELIGIFILIAFAKVSCKRELLLTIERKEISFLVFDDNFETLFNKINKYGGRIVNIFGKNAFVIKFPNNTKNKLSQLN